MNFFQRLTGRRAEIERAQLQSVDDVALAIIAGDEPDPDEVLAILLAADLTEADLQVRVDTLRERRRLQEAIKDEADIRRRLAEVEAAYAAERDKFKAAEKAWKETGAQLWEEKEACLRRLNQIETDKHELRKTVPQGERDKLNTAEIERLNRRRADLQKLLSDSQWAVNHVKLTFAGREAQHRAAIKAGHAKGAPGNVIAAIPQHEKALEQVEQERAAAKKELADVESKLRELTAKRTQQTQAAIMA